MTLFFVDKMFLQPSDAPLRGVELFNLRLVRDLAGMGFEIDFPCERSWAERIRKELGAATPRLIELVHIGSNAVNALLMIPRLLGARYDHFIIGNVGNGLIPLIRFLAPRCGNTVLIAHREAKEKFVRACRGATVVSVNGQIARPFEAAGCRTAVDYGVTESEAFFPAETRKEGPVRFCVLGMLDNAWKGADTAVAAYRALSGESRKACELHLASYSEPGDFGEGITAHGWMSPGDIPGFLRDMDVMIVPSRDEEVMRETFSQAMVQGMLCGLPLLVSELPILVEKLDAGGGRIFASAEELSELMRELAEDPDTRRQLGEEARRTALERYVWDSHRFAERYLELGA